MSHMELDLDSAGTCNILFLRHATPTPTHLREASIHFLGEAYKETHFQHLSAEGAVLAINAGMRLELGCIRGRNITSIASSKDARAPETLAAVMYGVRNLRPGLRIPTPQQTAYFSAWNSEHAVSMAREADQRIDALREKTRSAGALPDYEETVFHHSARLGLERLMLDTYHDMECGVETVTSGYIPGIHLIVGHAPNLSIFACGKFRDGGNGGLWNAMSVEQHIRVLGGVSVSDSDPLFRTPLPCEGFWYVVDSKNRCHGIIPLRHSPGILALHAETMVLQEAHRQMFIEHTLQPARDAKKTAPK